jgi:ATP-dependent DNA ligase
MKMGKITTKPPFPELRGKLSAVRWPAISEIKYDGEYNLLIYCDEGDKIRCNTLNKYGKTRGFFPAIDKIAADLRASDIQEATFLCELYTNAGKLGELYNLLGEKESDDLNISVFDTAMIKYKDGREPINVQSPLIDRREATMHALPNHDTHVTVCMNKDEAEAHFKLATSQGYEGTVIKSLDGPLIMGPCSWVKMKYKDQSDYPVIAIDPVKERVEVGVPDPNKKGAHVSTVKVGVKVMNKDKQTLTIGDLVTIEHQGVLDSGSLRHPVFKGKV